MARAAGEGVDVPVEFADGGGLGGPVLGFEEGLVEVADGLAELREAGEELPTVFDLKRIFVARGGSCRRRRGGGPRGGGGF